MRVRELINALLDFDPDSEVLVNDDSMYRDPSPHEDVMESVIL